MFLLMFVSPIAFEPSMVPEAMRFVVYANPVYYLIETFRDCLIAGRAIDPRVWAIQAVLSLSLYRDRRHLLPPLQEHPGRPRIMCGIAGMLAFDRGDTRVTAQVVTAMRECVAHRGPNGGSTWVDDAGRIGLGHRRLSIIDLADQANQPMANEDGSLRIIFNGEIYNHAELRRELSQTGRHRWSTDHSDTEVILHGFEEWGIDVLARLRGMFAFALWDAREQGVVAGARSRRRQAALLQPRRQSRDVCVGDQSAACGPGAAPGGA